MKKRVLASLSGLLISLLTPMSILVPRASAAAITWSGGGTPTLNTTLKTITYNVNDTANWVGGVVPADGDSWVFPANTADVDPGDSLTDDSSWTYIVNNDLTAGTDIAAISFNGDAGSCGGYDDRYTISGNAISLSGDVSNTMTASCASVFERQSTLGMDITVTSSISIDADISSNGGVKSLTYGANTLSLCNSGDANRGLKQISVSNFTVTGSGTLTLACNSNYLYLTTGSSVGNIIIASNSHLDGEASLYAEDGKTLTLNTGATFGISANANLTFARDIIFVGSGRQTTYCVTTTCTGEGLKTVEGYRLNIQNSNYNYTTKVTTYYKTTLSGDITFSHDTSMTLYSDLELTGALSGNYALSLVPGSRGKLTVNATTNNTKTANGTISPSTYTKKLSDTSFDQWVSFGQEAELQPDRTIDDKVTIAEGGKLKGSGTVAGIDVLTGGTLAPGLSPGCITSDGDLTLAGNYDVELGGATECTGYDRTTVTGAVNVTGATLNTSIINDYKPALNSTYTIIANDASDAVVGTFTGLAQGATFQVNGYTFQISYTGGDGNDVVLTTTAVPASATAPDTGIGSVLNNPLITLLTSLVLVGVVVSIRKMNA